MTPAPPKHANDNPKPCRCGAHAWENAGNTDMRCRVCGYQPGDVDLLTLFIAAGMFAVAGWWVVLR